MEKNFRRGSKPGTLVSELGTLVGTLLDPSLSYEIGMTVGAARGIISLISSSSHCRSKTVCWGESTNYGEEQKRYRRAFFREK